MTTANRMGRRQFIVSSAGAVAAGLGGACTRMDAEEIANAAAQVGRLPQRTLDGSGRKVSALVGTATSAPEAVEASILCGINYWHKTQKWDSRSVPRAMVKNREAFYCEIAVDRVRGNHETGVIDEEAHYQFVKQTVASTGLRYFDDLMLHYGYHHTAELKSERGFIRAYERLKKEGLVRHLCLSQHSYNGNPLVPGGEDAATVLTAVAADGLYEHAQFPFSFGDGEEINKFVSFARGQGFGTIAMKTTLGAARMQADREFMSKIPPGVTPHNALARWVTTQTELSAAVIQVGSLAEFVDTFSGAGKPLRAEHAQAIEMMTAYADREVCRLCNQCMSHCPQGLAIADIMRFERYAIDYHQRQHARRLYAKLDKQADVCRDCGSCLSHCPQGMEIPAKLIAAHRLLS